MSKRLILNRKEVEAVCVMRDQALKLEERPTFALNWTRRQGMAATSMLGVIAYAGGNVRIDWDNQTPIAAPRKHTHRRESWNSWAEFMQAYTAYFMRNEPRVDPDFGTVRAGEDVDPDWGWGKDGK